MPIINVLSQKSLISFNEFVFSYCYSKRIILTHKVNHLCIWKLRILYCSSDLFWCGHMSIYVIQSDTSCCFVYFWGFGLRQPRGVVRSKWCPTCQHCRCRCICMSRNKQDIHPTGPFILDQLDRMSLYSGDRISWRACFSFTSSIQFSSITGGVISFPWVDALKHVLLLIYTGNPLVVIIQFDRVISTWSDRNF